MLPESGQRIAAEAAVRADDRRTVGAGDVVVLFDVQIAVGRDRANFQRVGRAIRQMQIHAARVVDAELLRHADVGLRHPLGAFDLNQGRQGADAARRNRSRGERHDGQAVRVEVQQLAVERGVLVLADVRRQGGGEVFGGRPTRLEAKAATVIFAKACLARQDVLGHRALD